MTTPKYQPLTLKRDFIREQNGTVAVVFMPRYGSLFTASPALYNACAGGLEFLDKQIAEMEKFEPWECEVVEQMVESYRQMAVVFKLAIEQADGMGA